MSRVVNIAEFWNVYDATVAVSALESAGIPAICPDWHLFHLKPNLMFGATGVRLWVPNDRINEAEGLLLKGHDTATPVHPCPKCGGRTYRMRRWLLVIPITWLLLNLGVGMTYGPLVFYKRKRFCWICYHQHLPAPVEPFTDSELGNTP
jgi:hypothetical protein